MLIDWLKDRDATCPLCTYNLRGLTSPRCPECGQALQLSVSLVEPYLKAWIGLIAALLPPAGVGSILLCTLAYGILRAEFPAFNEFSRMPLSIGFMLVHVTACVPLSILAIAVRHRFLCWPRQTQRLCVLIAWVCILISITCLLSQTLR